MSAAEATRAVQDRETGGDGKDARDDWNEPITAAQASRTVVSEGALHLVVAAADGLLSLAETALVYEISLHEAAAGLFSSFVLFDLLARLPLRALASAASRGFSAASAAGETALAGSYFAYYVAIGLCWAVLSCVLFTPLAPYLKKAVDAPYDTPSGGTYLYLGLSLGALFSVFVEGVSPFLLAEGRLWCHLSCELSRFLVQTAAVFMGYFSFIQRSNRGELPGLEGPRAASSSPMIAYCVAALVSTVTYVLVSLRVPLFQAPIAGELQLDFRLLRPFDREILQDVFVNAIPRYMSSASLDFSFLVFNWCLSITAQGAEVALPRRSALYLCVRLAPALRVVPSALESLAASLYSRTVLHRRYERVRVFTMYLLIWGSVAAILVSLCLYFTLPLYQGAITAEEAADARLGSMDWEISVEWMVEFSAHYLPLVALTGIPRAFLSVVEPLAREEGNSIVLWIVCATSFALPSVGALCMIGIVGAGVELAITYLAAEIAVAIVSLLYSLYFVWKYRYLSKLSDMQAAARELESQLEQIE